MPGVGRLGPQVLPEDARNLMLCRPQLGIEHMKPARARLHDRQEVRTVDPRQPVRVLHLPPGANAALRVEEHEGVARGIRHDQVVAHRQDLEGELWRPIEAQDLPAPSLRIEAHHLGATGVADDDPAALVRGDAGRILEPPRASVGLRQDSDRLAGRARHHDRVADADEDALAVGVNRGHPGEVGHSRPADGGHDRAAEDQRHAQAEQQPGARAHWARAAAIRIGTRLYS